jgi:hypothetical protein
MECLTLHVGPLLERRRVNQREAFEAAFMAQLGLLPAPSGRSRILRRGRKLHQTRRVRLTNTGRGPAGRTARRRRR